MTALEEAAMRHADNHDYLDNDTMPRAERHAWVAAIEYARSMGTSSNAAKVDFAIYCRGRIDLDNAWAEWS